MDAEKLFNYEYNIREVNKRLIQIEVAAKGTNVSITSFMNDKNGNFSGRKAKNLISEMINNPIRRTFDGTVEDHMLDLEEKKFYEAFLYLSLQCFANEQMKKYGVYEEVQSVKCFQDILDKAKKAMLDLRFENREKLCQNEYSNLNSDNEEYPCSGFFATIDICISLVAEKEIWEIDPAGFEGITGDSIDENSSDKDIRTYEVDDNSEALNAEARAKGFSSYDEYMKKEEEDASRAGYDNVGDYRYDQYYNSLSEAEKERIQEQRKSMIELHEIGERSWKKFKREFTNKDEFLKMYRWYRDYFFKIDRYKIYESVESMIYGFLYRHELTPCINGKRLIRELQSLDNAYDELRFAIRE